MTDSNKVDFDGVYDMIKEIGAQERHFNDLNSRYKTMASTWLLAVFGGCGFVLANDINPASLYITGIGIAGSLGIYLLWLIDLRVYQQLLSACFIEGVKLELDHPWLPQVRINMMKSQPSGHVVPHLVWFYMLGFLIPLLISIWALSWYLLYINPYVAIGTGLVLLLAVFRVVKIIFTSSNERPVINDLFKDLSSRIKDRSLDEKDISNANIISSVKPKLNALIITQIIVVAVFIVFFITYFNKEITRTISQPELPQTVNLKEHLDYLAPDGSEIRLLVAGNSAGLAHCVLPVGKATMAVKHKTVDEIWYFIRGQGQVWRKQGTFEEIEEVSAGTSLTIPLGTHFQFKNTGEKPLEFVITTLPPWPGADEAVAVDGIWD